jgi:glycosyltransferase involved in cell wall biosynthesis
MPQNKTHILYLSYDGMTDPLGQSQVLAYLERLSKGNFRFTLISFEKKERFETGKKLVDERCKASGIRWMPLSYTKHPPVFSTLYDVWRLRKKVYKIFQADPFEIVHCRSYITALVGLQLKKKFGAKFIFDMRGFYADERVDGKIWNLKNPLYASIYRFFKRKELQFLSDADYVISLTEAGKNIIHSWNKIPNQPIPIQVIPCCADLDVFDASAVNDEAKEKLRKKLNLHPSDFVLSYLGSMGTWYMPDEMLECFRALKEIRPNSKFLFITNESPDFIFEKAKKKGIAEDDLRIVSSPHDLVPLYLSLSHAGIFFIKPVFSKQASSPTKQGEMMGMNLLHICNKGVGDVDAIVSQTNCGVVVQDFTQESYRKAVAELLEKASAERQNIRQQAFLFYSLEKGVRLYAEVYDKLIRNDY